MGFKTLFRMGIYPSMALYAGFVALYAQTLMLRTALTLFDGNELLTGFFLALWMLITAAGARVKLFVHPFWLWVFSATIALILPLTDSIAPSLFQYFFIRGSMPALYQSILFIAAWLSPFCLLQGIVFNMLVRSAPPEKMYAWETIGALCGGLVALILPWFQPTAGYLSLVPAVVWPMLLWIRMRNFSTQIVLYLLHGLFVLFIVGILMPSKHSTTETPQGRLQKVIYEGDTLYKLGAHFLPSPQYRPDETTQLHFALMQAPEHSQIMLIGTLNLSLLNDVVKYKTQGITWLDTSPFNTRLILNQTGKQLPSQIVVHPYNLKHLKAAKSKYDVVIVMNGEPSSLEASRWLSQEFFAHVVKILKSDGILCLNLPTVANYYSGEMLDVQASIVNSLRKYFSFIRLIPVLKTHVLASNASLDQPLEIGLEKASHFSDYVNSWFFNANELNRRSIGLKASLPKDIPPNTLSRPIAIALFQGYWVSLNQSRLALIWAGLTLLILGAMYRTRREEWTMFYISFITASLQLILLFLFQVVSGKIYLTAGLFFAFFMSGLAVCSYTKPLFNLNIKHLIITAVLISPLSITPFVIIEKILFPEFFYALWVSVFLLAAGGITGSFYRLLTHAKPSGASRIYAADLTGGAMGNLFSALVLVPLLGLLGNLLILSLAGFVTYVLAYRLKISHTI